MNAADSLAFVDTNILLYAHDNQAGGKREVAAGLLRRLWVEGRGVVSVQVLQEFFVNLTRKIPRPLSIAQARELIRGYATWVRGPTNVDELIRASEIMEITGFTFWDSLIVAAAETVGAELLYTEDLQHGRQVAGCTIVNPFLEAAGA